MVGLRSEDRVSLSSVRLLDAFRDAPSAAACPLCIVATRCERASLRSYLAESVMDSEARSRLSKGPFCNRHLAQLLGERDRLGLALILEATLSNLAGDASRGPLHEAVVAHLELQHNCPICVAVRDAVERSIDMCADLYVPGSEFATAFESSEAFCLPHFAEFMERLATSRAAARSGLLQKAADLQRASLSSLLEDLGWFIRKHDYRFAEEPWRGAQDVVSRAVRKIAGTEG